MLNPNLFPYLLGLSAFLFTVGAMGVLIRRNPIVVFMCIELMLNAANVALVAYGRFLNSEEGQIFAFMVIVVAAAEVVVGLALITQIFRLGRELDVDDLSEMKEGTSARRPSSCFWCCSFPWPGRLSTGFSDPCSAGDSSTSPGPSRSSPPSWLPASCWPPSWARRRDTAPSRFVSGTGSTSVVAPTSRWGWTSRWMP